MKKISLGGSTPQDPRGFLFSTTRVMRLTGILQDQTDKKWKKTYNFYSLIIFILIFVQTSSQIMDFIVRSRNITTIAQNAIFTLLSINSVFKAFWLWKKRAVVAALLDDMNSSFRLNPPVAKELNLEANKPVNMAYYSFLNLTTMAHAFWMSSPFLQYATAIYRNSNTVPANGTQEALYIYDIGYTLPARAWFPIDVFRYPTYYIAYGFQFVSLSYIVFISISVDLLCCVSLLRVNAQLMYLQSDLETAGQLALRTVLGNSQKGSGDVGNGEVLFTELTMELTRIGRRCVLYHADILRVLRRLDAVLGGLALMTTRLYTLVLVIGAMTIVEARGIDAQSLQLIVYSSCFVYQLYLFYSPADDIILSQYQLANSVEVGLWSPVASVTGELAYIIQRIIMMANKPAIFTAGYLHMDRNTYRKELQQVASMFNALWQMKNAGRI